MAIDDIIVKTEDPEEQQEEEEEEDLVDPLEELKEYCGNTSHCVPYGEKLQSCNDRVNSRTKTEETCSEELFDYLHCVDHCLSQNLFQKLK